MARSAASGKPRRDDREHSAAGASPWEWVCAAVGFALVAGAIGYLVYFAVATPAGPPAITFEQGPVERSGGGYVVVIVVSNQGASTAASLEIEGTLIRDGAAVETSTATLDYLPRFSTRNLGLFFGTDPRDGRLELRALGYAEP